MPTAPLLELEGVGWRAPSGRAVLEGVNLRLLPGDFLWVCGPSGGGKSSLLRLINRLAEPSAGAARVLGRPQGQWRPDALRRAAALLGQTPVMLPGTVAANLLAGFSLAAGRRQTPPERGELARRLVELDLAGVELDAPAGDLSVGQRQRVALLRLLLLGPALLLLDEPLAPLDPAAAQAVEAVLADFTAGGGGVIMVSHQPPRGGNRRARLAEGRLEEVEP